MRGQIYEWDKTRYPYQVKPMEWKNCKKFEINGRAIFVFVGDNRPERFS